MLRQNMSADLDIIDILMRKTMTKSFPEKHFPLKGFYVKFYFMLFIPVGWIFNADIQCNALIL